MTVDIVTAAMPVSMVIAVAGAVAIGWMAARITVRVYREKVRRMSRTIRSLTEQLDSAEFDLADERHMVDRLVIDLDDTRRCLRSVVADPLQGGTHHVAMDRVREVAARPLPGEPTGTHAATTTEETDRG